MLVACEYSPAVHSTATKMNLPSATSINTTHRVPPPTMRTPSEAARPFNGRCKYKSGRCMNERTLKENGLPHTLCEEHRILHNKNQRKSDTKRRRLRKGMPYEPRSAPTIQMIHDLEYRSAGSTYSSEQEDARSGEEFSDDDNQTPVGGGDHTPRVFPSAAMFAAMDDISLSNHHQHIEQSSTASTATAAPVEWSNEEISMLHSLLGIKKEI
ncbi:Aste57867_25013 [Aphanomyces stellatus]|uniref:Aste57867_25013 protein n=1 Tax=Aphanomyces stellatus TaxID=120398 RepID=A0A485LSW3_9STRA|nr:hypothetical protein As57867_024935 [Aphanomyces stellatus]VFU01644.1 Aste57867_25013 [Aphanomyces stellatus]